MESTLDHEMAPDDGSFLEILSNADMEAVQAAVMNVRSDSVLVGVEDKDEDDDDNNDDEKKSKTEKDYMEKASVEAARINSKTKVLESQPSNLSQISEPSINVNPDDSVPSMEDWEHGSFSVPQDLEHTFASSMHLLPPKQSELTEKPPARSPPIISKSMDLSIESVLRTCGVLPFSSGELAELWNRSEDELVRAISRRRFGQQVLLGKDSSRPDSEKVTNAPPRPVLLMHSLFCTFCFPAPTVGEIWSIYQTEQKQEHHTKTTNSASTTSNPLPLDPLIHVSSSLKSPVVKLLLQPQEFIKLPLAFQKVFFRILIRLLTNETDVEYNKDYNCDWFQKDALDRNSFAARPRRDSILCSDPSALSEGPLKDSSSRGSTRRGGRRSSSSSEFSSQRVLKPEEIQRRTSDFQSSTHDRVNRMRQVRTSISDKHRRQQSWIIERLSSSVSALPSKRPNQLYAIVRFRSGDAWGDEQNAATAMLDFLDAVLKSSAEDDKEEEARSQQRYLLGPSTRLLGLLCTAGVTVQELRRMLSLTLLPITAPPQLLERLLMVRALSTAAEGASRSAFWAGKGSPQYFYSFGKSPKGLTRTIKSLPNWPFRNDFGMAVWFRCESTDCAPTLLKITTPDGGGVQVSLAPLDSNATAITVMTFDSPGESKDPTFKTKDASALLHPRVVVLKSCIILPRAWYHLAIRHTRSRLKGVFGMSARQQISILLDGKLLLTEPLQFPNIALQNNDQDTSGSKNLLSSLRKQNTISVNVQFGINFEGQAGALYLFNENVSDSTFKALYEVTAGTKGTKKEAITDGAGSTAHSVVELNAMDADELAITNLHDDTVNNSTSNRITSGTRPRQSIANVIDLTAEGEEQDADIPPELSKAAFASKLFLVWDPRRTEGSVSLDLHAGAHVLMNKDNVQPWHVNGAKDVIGSIGGIQALLPIFATLLSSSVHKQWQAANDRGEGERISSMIPDLISMVAAFLRNHDKNAREMMRCGGIDVIEKVLLRNKSLSNSTHSLFGILRTTPGLGSLLVDSLVELRLACHHYDVLESTVFSRLLFNFPLWFAGAGRASGVSLHSTLLPLLSSITNATPQKVRDLIGVRPMIEILHEYTDIGERHNEWKKYANNEPATELFDRSPTSELSNDAPLSLKERRHAIDIIMGMVATILVSGAPPSQLFPLLNYISYNADFEWEQGSNEANNGRSPNVREGSRQERHLANMKASSVFLFLLKGHPPVDDLLKSLSYCCGGTQGTASWILCTLVNSFDDELRSIGIRCLADYLDVAVPKGEVMLTQGSESGNAGMVSTAVPSPISTKRTTARFSVLSNMSKSLSALNTRQVLSPMFPLTKPVSVDIVYKLLWHLLKCHRMRIGKKTHAALIHLLLEDRGLTYDPHFLVQELVMSDEILHTGYRLSLKLVDALLAEFGSVAGKKLRKSSALNVILRLLRFLPNAWKEKWLLDLVDMITTCPPNVAIIVRFPEWQPSLFHVVSDILEEIKNKHADAEKRPQEAEGPALGSNIEEPGENDRGSELKEVRSSDLILAAAEEQPITAEDQKRLQARFNLALKLYSNLLAHCFRQGGEKGIAAVEQVASLERVCVNGHDVVCLVLNYLLVELIDKGTVDAIRSNTGHMENNWYLKESSRVVTTAILSHGSNGNGDSAFAVRQWHGLRHLAAVTGCIITKSGFGMGDLFDYRNQPVEPVEAVSRGLYGVRLPEQNVGSLTAVDLGDAISVQTDDTIQDQYRRICVMLTAQILTLLDAFIFPDSLDASLPASQLHGLALVRGGEGRLGVAQGPILAALIRMSLVLICNLEPSGVKFLQCCSRLRCFLHWGLELIRESVAMAGYSAAFHDLTAPIDRLVLATVLHSHRALARCGVVLKDVESSEFHKYFRSEDSKKKNIKRLLRVSFELREIIVTAFRGRNEVLRASLSHGAFEALQRALEHQVSGNRSRRISSKEATIRAFLQSKWVSGFQDVRIQNDLPVLETSDQGPRQKIPSQRGYLAMEELSDEATEIVLEFNRALNSAFLAYCEDQKNWAETDAVRDLEYDGDTTVKRFSSRFRSDLTESSKLALARGAAAQSRWKAVERKITELWDSDKAHWKLARHTDLLGRRILLTRNRNFDDHEKASYETMLGLEREKAEKEREERLRKKREKEISENRVRKIVMSNSAYIAYGTDDEESTLDDQEEMEDDSDLVDDSGVIEDSDLVRPCPRPRHLQHEMSLEDLETEAETTFPDSGTVDTDFELLHGSDTNPAEEHDVDAWAKTFIWSDAESVVARFDGVMVVTLRTITEGRLLLTTHGLYFNHTGDVINVMTKERGFNADSDAMFEHRDLRWRLSRLTEVHGRRFMLRAQAIELFFSDSIELFLNFTGGTRERDKFYAKLRNSCKVPLLWSPKSLNPRVVFKKSKITQLWRKGKISNFQYLMHLNKMAGRTFNDITQYPVFPWVLSDYTSQSIDLNDSRVYRDLSKPVGALNPDRLATLIERYNDLTSFGFSDNEKFLYGSHYSSPGVVLHYLIRQEPFTSMAIELQSGRFDCPDRLFFDIAGCWRSCLTSTSDVKELVPELFTCPEVFRNTNNFPLGTTQDNRSISDVALPPWANGSAHEFVRIHRLALESDIVSRNLHHWIDLIFGYKQRGLEAEAAHNVFHYLSYEGAVDMSKITDEVERKAAESHIQNFGQTPSQLLIKDPHPSRHSPDGMWRPLIYSDNAPRYLRCHLPPKQFGFRRARGAVLSIQVMTDSILAVYADNSVGTYKFTASRSSRHPFSFRMDKHRSLARRDLSTSRAAIKRGSAAPASMDDSRSHLSVGNWSFTVTIGGIIKETMRRKAHTSRNQDSVKDAEASALLVSCGYWDDTVKVHSIDGVKLHASDSGGHVGPIRCIALGSDGAMLVTGGQDATCRVWVVDHPDMASALSDGYVQTALGESTDNGYLTCCHVLWGHDTPVTCLDLSADLDVVVSGSTAGTICIHTLRRGRFVRSVEPLSKSQSTRSSIRKLAMDNHGTFIAHLQDGTLHSYTINGAQLKTRDAGEILHDMKLCSDGQMLVTGGERGRVVVRTVRDLQVRSMLDISQHGPIRCISLTPEELNPVPQFLFIGSDDGMITIVDEDPKKSDGKEEEISFTN